MVQVGCLLWCLLFPVFHGAYILLGCSCRDVVELWGCGLCVIAAQFITAHPTPM